MSSLSATDSGGAIYAIRTSTTETPIVSSLKVTNCYNLYSNTATNSGGFMTVAHSYMAVQISDSDISETKVTAKTGYGGAFYITKVASVTLTTMSLTDIFAANGAIIYSTASSSVYSLSYSTITCNSTLSIKSPVNLTSTFSTALYFQNAQLVTSKYNTFTQCGTGDKGGVF